MNHDILKNSSRKSSKPPLFLLQSATELIFFMPFLLTISIYFTSPIACVIWAITLWIGYCFIHLIMSRKQVNKQYQAIMLVFICLVMVVGIQLPFNHVNIFGNILIIAASFYVLNSSILSVKHRWINSFSISHMVMYLAGHIVLQVLKVIWLTNIQDYQYLYVIFGIISFIIFLFSVNERMLGDHQHIDQKTRSFRNSLKLNRILIGCFSIIIIFLTMFREVQREIEAWLRELINKIIAWFNGMESHERTDPLSLPSPNNNPMEGLVAEEPSKFWKYLDAMLSFAMTLIIVIAVVVVLYLLVKKCKGIIAAIINRLFHPLAVQMEESSEYIDVVEQLRQDKTLNPRRKSKAMKKRNWDTLTNNEKVRLIYTTFVTKEIKSGYQIDAAHTATQTLEQIAKQKHNSEIQAGIEEMKVTYNEARYRDEVIEYTKLKKILKFFEFKK